ncbi:MAG: hemerythrin domain-containing protein [Elusimicrobia bacterium]|nr:hemerythrin domain-containing protein [Elusimicrobiota bacterium]
MNSVMEFMRQDHARLDGIFAEFGGVDVQSEKARELFSAYRNGLERHIAWEEEILFPVFEEKTGNRESGPTAVMRMEHREIKVLLERLYLRVENGDIEIKPIQERLGDVLAEHNQKEESVLYPWFDQSLSETEKQALLDKIKSSSAAP